MKYSLSREEKDYLDRCKKRSPESRLEWLWHAIEFTREIECARKKKGRRNKI